MLRDPETLAADVADLVEQHGGARDVDALRAVLSLGLEHAAPAGDRDLLPYEVMLIRLAKYVATQLPGETYRDRPRRAAIRRRLSDLLIAQGLDPAGARVVPRR